MGDVNKHKWERLNSNEDEWTFNKMFIHIPSPNFSLAEMFQWITTTRLILVCLFIKNTHNVLVMYVNSSNETFHTFWIIQKSEVMALVFNCLHINYLFLATNSNEIQTCWLSCIKLPPSNPEFNYLAEKLIFIPIEV